MRIRHKQQGLSSLGWLVVIAVFGFCLTSLFKLGPHYLEHYYVQTALKTLAKQYPDFQSQKNAEIKNVLTRFMDMNNVRDPQAREFDIVKLDGRKLVNSNYEIRVPFMGNVDVVLNFKSQLNSEHPEQCCKYTIDVGEKAKK